MNVFKQWKHLEIRLSYHILGTHLGPPYLPDSLKTVGNLAGSRKGTVCQSGSGRERDGMGRDGTGTGPGRKRGTGPERERDPNGTGTEPEPEPEPDRNQELGPERFPEFQPGTQFKAETGVWTSRGHRALVPGEFGRRSSVVTFNFQA